MINWIRKFFLKKPYVCCMELHNILECYLSLKPESIGPIEGFHGFFHENHFMIGHRMFDPEWDNKIQLEEIYKKLLLVYNFNLKDENIVVVRGKEKIYIPERGFHVPLPPGGVFVYDKRKLKIFT